MKQPQRCSGHKATLLSFIWRQLEMYIRFCYPVIQTAHHTPAFGSILLFPQRLTGHMNVKQGHVANHDVSGYASNAATFWRYWSETTEWWQISGTVSETGSYLGAQITQLNVVFWWIILQLSLSGQRNVEWQDESWIGKELKGNCRDLIDVLCRQLAGRKKGSPKIFQSR